MALNLLDPVLIFSINRRPEIVTLRESIKGNATVEEPEVHDRTYTSLLLRLVKSVLIDDPAAGFRALVEENVKASVGRIATDHVILNVSCIHI